MSLRTDAVELSRALNQIVESARASKFDYLLDLAGRIAPLVASYDSAVFDLRSREGASSAIDELADDLDAISAAAARGEMDAFEGDILDRYWRLRTIFREARYRDEAL